MTGKTITFGVHGSVVFDMDIQSGPLPHAVHSPTGNLDTTVWITCTEDEARTMAAWLSSRRDQNPEYEAAAKVIDWALRQSRPK